MKRLTLFTSILLVFSFITFRCDDSSVNNDAAITIISPNGGENLQIGTTQTIQWTSKSISGDVRIEISFDGGSTFSMLIPGVPNTGSYNWVVSGQTTSEAILRISSLTDRTIHDESNAGFTVFEIVARPIDLVASVVGQRQISLAWQDRSNNENGFSIERKVGLNGLWEEIGLVSLDRGSFSDTGLVSNSQYFYRVRAYTTNGYSDYTNVVSRILGWVQQASGTTNPLYSVFYVSQTNGVAVGKAGTILLTQDGGDSWSRIIAATSSNLYGVSFTNSQIGVAVGSEGTVLRTSDGGASWTVQVIGGVNYNFKGTDFASPTEVYAVGSRKDIATDSTWGIIYHSTDLGVHWTLQTEQWNYSFEDVTFAAPDIGTVVGSFRSQTKQAVFRTTNGGTQWLKQLGDGPGPLFGVHFLDANIGTTVGIQGTILKTTNGGVSWVNQLTSTSRILRKVAYADIIRGIVVGDEGTILKTTTGGNSWFAQPSGTIHHLDGLFMSDSNTITIVGDAGVILKTNNGGQ